ncbi:MAG: M28 family metallopeptidase [Bacillota bacterium]
MNKSKILTGSVYSLIVILVIGLGLFIGCQPARKQLTQEEKGLKPQTVLEKENIKKHIKILTSKELEGRRAGTSGDGETVLYLAQELKKMNLKPLGKNTTYFQTFHLPLTGLKWEDNRLVYYLINEKSKLLTDNVLALLESPVRPGEYIIISAHHDHLGSLDNQLYPGANDNASGVAAVLEMARVLKSKEHLPYSVIIAFWGGEEMGLLGSSYFVENPVVDPAQVRMVINLDSIGSGADNDFIIWNGDAGKIVQGIYSHLQELEGGEFVLENTTQNSSDHKPFSQAQIPAITILAANWLNKNHTSLDNQVLINYDKIFFLAKNLIDYLTSEDIVNLLESNR